jgi:hypothetical protein
MFEVLVTGGSNLAIRRGTKIKSLSALPKTLKQSLMYVGLIRTMGCAMSTESLKEEGPIFGALKERGAV